MSNYEAHTRIRMSNTSQVHAPNIANRYSNRSNLDSHVKLGFATNFSALRGSGNLLESLRSQNILAFMILRALGSCPDACLRSRFLDVSCSAPCVPARWDRPVPFLFVYQPWQLWHRHDVAQNLKNVPTVHRLCTMPSECALPGAVLPAPHCYRKWIGTLKKKKYCWAESFKNRIFWFLGPWER